MIRLKLDAEQFGAVFENCKDNPLFGYKLGYVCNAHMTPEQFIRANGIELIEETNEMNGLSPFVEVAI
jgi:hypothetical protein